MSARATIYLAAAPESNASAKAIWSARRGVRDDRTAPVPRHLVDGENYLYPHDSADGYVPQEYPGVERVNYVPTDRGDEAEIARRLKALEEGSPSTQPRDGRSASR